jgi:thiol-disulfide isomerase/thioredoxin
MKFCCPALLLSILAVDLPAQDDAKSLLREVAATYKAARSYHFESSSESVLSSEMQRSWSSGREVIGLDPAGRARYEVLHSSGSLTVVSDGKILWRASADTREFNQTPVTGPLFEITGGGPLAQNALRRMKFRAAFYEKLEDHLIKAERLRDEPVEIGARSIDCAVVRADYDPPTVTPPAIPLTRTYWIDKARRIILREDSVSRGMLFPSQPFVQAQSTHSTRYTVASINEPVPDSLFTYTPPANFREVDKLEYPHARPATELLGKAAPELTLTTLTGEGKKLSDLRGKPVLLDFWAAWCDPCRQQLPTIAKLYQETRQDVVILGVNDDESPEAALKFLNGKGYDWPHLFDGTKKEARKKFKVEAIPTLVLIDKQGKVAAYDVGAGEAAETAIREALAKLKQ